jgi:hypothetical protein
MEFPCFLWKFHVLKNGSWVERCQNGAFFVHTTTSVHTSHVTIYGDGGRRVAGTDSMNVTVLDL